MFNFHKIALYSTIMTVAMGLELPASAIPNNWHLETTGTLVGLDFPDRGSPQTGSVGGGTRGTCVSKEDMSLFKSLVPTDYWVTTLAANPSLFWHIPKNKATYAELVVLDQDGTIIYNKELELPQQIQEKSAILQLNLPENTLEEGKSYLWEFALVCDPLDRGSDAYYVGTVERFSLDKLPPRANQLPNKRDLENNLAKLQQEYRQMTVKLNSSAKENTQLQKPQVDNLLAQAQIYTQLDLWSETFQIIAQLREARPDEWQDLLTSIGIQQPTIINAPLMRISVTENAGNN